MSSVAAPSAPSGLTTELSSLNSTLSGLASSTSYAVGDTVVQAASGAAGTVTTVVSAIEVEVEVVTAAQFDLSGSVAIASANAGTPSATTSDRDKVAAAIAQSLNIDGITAAEVSVTGWSDDYSVEANDGENTIAFDIDASGLGVTPAFLADVADAP